MDVGLTLVSETELLQKYDFFCIGTSLAALFECFVITKSV